MARHLLPGGHDAGDDDQHHDEGQHPVAELDVLVERLRLVGDRCEGRADALGPGGAAKTRAGQAYEAAGDHDPHLRDDARSEDPPSRRGGEGHESDGRREPRGPARPGLADWNGTQSTALSPRSH